MSLHRGKFLKGHIFVPEITALQVQSPRRRFSMGWFLWARHLASSLPLGGQASAPVHNGMETALLHRSPPLGFLCRSTFGLTVKGGKRR